ncbi:MAG: hypothetical protein H0T91_08515 [Propionibacteriaceae bacterium]|nr:hypothetical protein [Propionibacteriaceae bacterium]
MTDYHQLGYWLSVTGLLLSLRVPFVRRVLSNRLSQFGSWAVERARPAPEFDQLADELYQVLRREKLRSDLRRLQRIVATDMSMSATRQLGNRLAYQWLLRELESTRDRWQPTGDDGAVNWGRASALSTQPTDPVPSHYSQRPPKVEILEIGWKR